MEMRKQGPKAHQGSSMEESKIKRTKVLLQRIWDGSTSPHFTQPKGLYYGCSESLTEKHCYRINTESFVHDNDGTDPSQ